MRRQEGPDFDVFYFSDAATKSSMGLYVGHNPGLRSSEAVDVRRQTGRIGVDSLVEWSRWSQGGRHRSETLVHDFYGQSAPRAYAGLLLHIFIAAPAEQDITRMEAAAATLRLERAR